ncbi:orotidine-5'-phosphate decarboxylase [Corynebacterium breve]|uniref:Orotidine 5'-phosphate decarboxylase n=1 Tax=Corynebacterium breve TaxID=3049799 RepID=A0ABY8VL07_9CORY|nr:orotidine-5'-phosphate decarboxylase [Corynebacterium breve]WIM68913.1 orotidine-5'-phosphate decarboxylase [Corynebacterium breve]
MTFGERLAAAGERYGRLCVGIDPHASLLHSWGLQDSVEGLRDFSRRCVEAFSGHVALVKPQVAFYERFGAHGFMVLEETIASLRETGTLVVADAKRGDIGSTMAGYAEAWLGETSLRSDAVTVSPYLGVGALKPVFDEAQKHEAGVFVLGATSNPEAVAFQSQRLENGKTVAQYMVDECAALNVGETVGSVGVVVGATLENPPVLDALNGPVLMPGVGAQGGTADDVARIAGKNFSNVFPSVSRSVLAAGPDVRDLRKHAIDQAKQY